MLHIVNLEEIQNLLLQVPKLINQLEQRDSDFIPQVKRWLSVVEEVLINNRLPLAGNVAALRGTLEASERGVIPPRIALHGRPTARKIKEATAADVVLQASELVATRLQEEAGRLSEAERLAHQLAALAKAKGLTRPASTGIDATQQLSEIWQALANEPETAPGIVRLESLLAANDGLILLDRALSAFTLEVA